MASGSTYSLINFFLLQKKKNPKYKKNQNPKALKDQKKTQQEMIKIILEMYLGIFA